jgi:hypothetical protein
MLSDEQKALDDLVEAKLSGNFSYRRAYFVGAKAQHDQDKQDREAERKAIVEYLVNHVFKNWAHNAPNCGFTLPSYQFKTEDVYNNFIEQILSGEFAPKPENKGGSQG